MRAHRAPAIAAVLLAAVAHGEPPASVWNTGTAPPPAATAPEPTAPTAMPLRVYEGLGAVGPLYAPPDEAAYAVDVVAEFATCPDGARIVTALQLAGHRYPVANRCAARPAPATGAAGAAGASSVARCDARRWTCRSGGDR
jgi:hypothetical protein